MSVQSVQDLKSIAAQVRGTIVQLIHDSNTMHLGSSLSCTDILVAAYWNALHVDPESPNDPARDRLILSKGHAAPALFAALAHRGFFPLADLATYDQNGSYLGEHPPAPGHVPGVEAATGSLGHGVPMGLGMAYALKLAQSEARVYAIASDGECNEGSIWEAALVAPAKGLDNLCVVVDFNKWQATGRSAEVTELAPLADKWRAFGWSTYEVDGHDLHALVPLLQNVPDGSGKPVAIVAHTVKGKGVSFMEDDNNWHYRCPTEDEVKQAHKELGLA